MQWATRARIEVPTYVIQVVYSTDDGPIFEDSLRSDKHHVHPIDVGVDLVVKDNFAVYPTFSELGVAAISFLVWMRLAYEHLDITEPAIGLADGRNH